MNHTKCLPVFTAVLFMLISTGSGLAAPFNIQLNLNDVDVSYHSSFYDAQNFWESVIVGYQDGIDIESLQIDAVIHEMDGVGGRLGTAGPTDGRSFERYEVANQGSMAFDIADIDRLSSQELLSLLLHEMAHVIGFGTLWDRNGVYVTDSGRYTGAAGLAAYQGEFDLSATYVPVELEGANPGTANGHWDETEYGLQLTGITDTLGRDMQNELMTGWMNSPTFVSNTTIMSFVDIGYEVAAVPLPSACFFLAAGLIGIAGFKRKT